MCVALSKFSKIGKNKHCVSKYLTAKILPEVRVTENSAWCTDPPPFNMPSATLSLYKPFSILLFLYFSLSSLSILLHLLLKSQEKEAPHPALWHERNEWLVFFPLSPLLSSSNLSSHPLWNRTPCRNEGD